MRLAHLRIPQVTKYSAVADIQTRLVNQVLQYKSTSTSTSSAPSPDNPPPDATIITAQFHPVYTCGRREIGTVSAAQRAFLRTEGRADFVEALRGGQTTFHGPGQLVAYPIVDLKRLGHVRGGKDGQGLSPRCYVRLLEDSAIATIARWGIPGQRTEHAGVWTSPERKIAALGLHLRRNVTSHGVALNVDPDLWWFERIVACGLEGKETTSMEREGVPGVPVLDVADAFVAELAGRLHVDDADVYRVHLTGVGGAEPVGRGP
ncbi:MAG: hypothetical protein M1838_001467 [Thelocarpon superellum]|nr:MAG: hypothetical protein M1838_001467 [Thelocarpon superellum]